MASYGERIERFMRLETDELVVKAKRARVFDHRTNKGNEAEVALREWLSRRLAPDYLVASGELIDSFDTNADRDSRQLDAIVFGNTSDSNRFVFPSGARLVPIESVSTVLEIKLTLTQEEFRQADVVATEIAQLRVRPDASIRHLYGVYPGEASTSVSADEIARGIPVGDERLNLCMVQFGVFGFFGPSQVDTLARWLANATTLNFVVCLDAGAAYRIRHAGEATVSGHVHEKYEALSYLHQMLLSATTAHRIGAQPLHYDYSRYARFARQSTVSSSELWRALEARANASFVPRSRG